MLRLLQAFAVLLAFAAPGLAAGTVPPAKIAAVQKASDDFAKLGAESRQSGKPPRESDPRAKALLDVVLDVSSLKPLEPLPLSEIGNVNTWNKAVLNVGIVYIFAGTKVADPSKPPDDPALMQQVEKNTVEFAPEMGRYFDAQLGITQAMLALVNAHLAANPQDREKPNFKAGLPDISGGAARTLASTISTLPTKGLSDEWRRARVPAMISLAPQVAKLVDAETLKALHDLANEAVEAFEDPALKEGLRKLAAAFQG